MNWGEAEVLLKISETKEEMLLPESEISVFTRNNIQNI